MIPQCYPSTVSPATGRRQMVVFFLSSVTGLKRWTDYIPVKYASATTIRENSFDTGGAICIDSLASTTGKQAGVDYINVFIDTAATDAWQCSGAGYLPITTSGGPLSLFAAGEQGGWWDPSDFSTMWQDSAGTTPVTATGQPVGKINDKSGRGNHRTQATAASRPTLQQDASGYYYLNYDGVDDFMVTGSVDFSATDKLAMWAGVRKLSDTAIGMVFELSSISDSNNGTFFMTAPRGAGSADFGVRSKGTVVGDSFSGLVFPSPASAVVTGVFDISGATGTLRVNGSVKGTLGSQGTGNYGNYPIYFGMRGGTAFAFNGREYSTVIRAATSASTASQVSAMETFVGSKMGIVM